MSNATETTNSHPVTRIPITGIRKAILLSDYSDSKEVVEQSEHESQLLELAQYEPECNDGKSKSERMIEKLKTRQQSFGKKQTPLTQPTVVKSERDEKILEMVRYYETKCISTGNSVVFRSLSNDYWNHKNWVHFQRIYELCEKNKFNINAYIDSQFSRMSYWSNTNQRYPYPNQMYSEKAQKAYTKYCEEYTQSQDVYGTMGKLLQPKGGKILSIREYVRGLLHHAYDVFAKNNEMYWKDSNGNRFYNPDEELANLILTPNFQSGVFMAQFEWAQKFFKRSIYAIKPNLNMTDILVTHYNRLRCMVRDIQENKALMKLIRELLVEVEAEFEGKYPEMWLKNPDDYRTQSVLAEFDKYIEKMERKHPWLPEERIYDVAYKTWDKK